MYCHRLRVNSPFSVLNKDFIDQKLVVPRIILIKCLHFFSWPFQIFRRLLEPIITLDLLQEHPVTLLFELCQKDGKLVEIKHSRKEDKNLASVFVDGQFVVTASSDRRENAKLHAAEAALQKLSYSATNKLFLDIDGESNPSDGPKQKLHELCGKKKWGKPCYRYEVFSLNELRVWYLAISEDKS